MMVSSSLDFVNLFTAAQSRGPKGREKHFVAEVGENRLHITLQERRSRRGRYLSIPRNRPDERVIDHEPIFKPPPQ
jgi:hypothetical protein